MYGLPGWCLRRRLHRELVERAEQEAVSLLFHVVAEVCLVKGVR
jgi:hypothetical protein